MLLSPVTRLVLALLAALLASTLPAAAENDTFFLRNPDGYRVPGAGAPPPQQRRQRTVQQAPYGYGYYAPAPRAYSPPVQYYYGRVDPYYDPRRDPRYVAPRAPRPAPQRPVVRRRPPPAAAPAPVQAEPAKQEAKVEIATRLVTFGDHLADSIADGLSEAFEDAAEVEVISEARTNAGLVRTEGQDWPKIVRDGIAANDKTAIGLVLMGVNDRQPIRVGDQNHEPLSERWRQLFAERVDAVAAAFNERRVPFIWIGAPPVRGERQSADLIAMNEIIRERVQRAGGVFVDVWPGFVDDENRFTPSGPDHRGQTTRLRSGDGVGFTRAGARTAAEFAVIEIKRIVDRRGPGAPAVAGTPETPDPKQREAAIDRMIDSAVQNLPNVPTVAPLPSKPVAGPVVPLTRPEVAPGGVLLVSRPALDGDPTGTARRALEQGLPPSPRPGRAADFRGPR